MYPGKADEWLYLERGVGAFYYTMFQRTITTLTAMYASHDIYNTACKRCCLSVIIKSLPFSISIASYTSLAFFMSNRDETRRLATP